MKMTPSQASLTSDFSSDDAPALRRCQKEIHILLSNTVPTL